MEIMFHLLMFVVPPLLGLTSPVTCADILMVPIAHGFNSRFMNMEKIADMLIDAGHNTSMLTNSIVEKRITNTRATWYIYDMSGIDNVSTVANDFPDLMMNGSKDGGIYSLVDGWIKFEMPFCKALLGTGNMLPRLKAKNFDLLIVDVGDDCNRIIADYLDIPTIVYSNYGFNCDSNLFYPHPVTFVCSPELHVCNSDDMNFRERMANFIAFIIKEFFTLQHLYNQYDLLRQEYGFNVTLKSKDSFNWHVVMANTDFAIDFPRPVMPHVITISGIFRKDPKPLTSELEAFFSSSGDHGVVVLSLGTYAVLTESQSEIFARTFAKLPQKVLWQHSGTKPKGLGSNTKIMKWIPQNDALAHPKAALFITHCGIASTFEAAIHGVPVVTIPLLLDQHYNSARLVKRAKMGVEINIQTLNEPDLAWAIDHVINTKSYRKNAKATVELLHDSPYSPKQLFLYWVDYVIRYHGAHHLQSAPVRRMSFVQYFGIDILAMLLSVFFFGIFFVCVFCVFLCCIFKRLTRVDKKVKQT